MTDFAYKALIFTLWPLLAPALLLLLAAMFVIAWPAIWFGKLNRKPDGGLELTFK